jgi:predicted kinase
MDELTYYMLTGVPASGKSTWIRESFTMPNVISSDAYIEFLARCSGQTYNQVFQDSIKDAQTFSDKCLRSLIAGRQTIIHDQTNLSVKSRRAKLSLIPSHYRKVAVAFTAPMFNDANWYDRLESRPGKTIPNNVLYTMLQTYVLPIKEEGFDEVMTIDWRTGDVLQ